MNIKEILSRSTEFLKKHDISKSRLEAEVLLAHLLEMQRINLYVNFDLPLEKKELDKYRELLVQRSRHVPTAYLTGKREFMSLDMKVNENVLIPRPETEHLVEGVIDYCKEYQLESPNIVDIGTGSGAVAVALGYYIHKARILGIDISREALEVARANIDNYELGERVKVCLGDLLQPLIKKDKNNVDIVVSNPPYIPDNKMPELMPEVQQEPRTALAAGEKGLDFYKKIIPQAPEVLKEGGLLAVEIGSEQAADVEELFDSKWSSIIIKKDYSGLKRIIFASL